MALRLALLASTLLVFVASFPSDRRHDALNVHNVQKAQWQKALLNMTSEYDMTKEECEAPKNLPTTLVVGTGPFCKGKPKDCTNRGYVYARDATEGDTGYGGGCIFGGVKVLCNIKPGSKWYGSAPFCRTDDVLRIAV